MTLAIPKRSPDARTEFYKPLPITKETQKVFTGIMAAGMGGLIKAASRPPKSNSFMALDLSSTCTGWAVGEKGKKPTATGSIRPPKGSIQTDAERFLFFWESIKGVFVAHGCGFFLAEELNHFTNARTARLLAGLAGAISVLAKKELDCEVLFLNTAKCRATISVNLNWDVDGLSGKKTRPDVKKRVAQRLEFFGIKGLPEDEADACVILLAAGVLVQQK